MTGGLPAPYVSPLFATLAPWLGRLPGRPDAAAVAALAEGLDLRTTSGLPVRFVPPRDDGLAYEERVWERGEVETRPDNWHDFFNALAWMAFPRAKAALNARHREAWLGADAPRGAARDAMTTRRAQGPSFATGSARQGLSQEPSGSALTRGEDASPGRARGLTHFDECGMVVVSWEPSLLELLKGFRWRELFVERRGEVMRSMAFFVFGHATYEQLLAPFRGLTAKAVLYQVEPDWLRKAAEEQLADLDARLTADLAAGRYAASRDLQPLPLLGIPGVTPASEDPAYYDDIGQFRPGRRG